MPVKEKIMGKSPLVEYLSDRTPEEVDSGFLTYLSALQVIKAQSPKAAASIVYELRDQRKNLKLIASENYSSLATQFAMGNMLTDKYAEGFTSHRFYSGCDNIDIIEGSASAIARRVFGVDHAYIQPHSGADANLIAYWAILTTRIQNPVIEELGEKNVNGLTQAQWNDLREKLGNQRLLGLDYYSGGHLTHGYRHNISAKMFDAYSYGVSKETGLLDYDEIERIAMDVKPFILLTGYSAYPRLINFKRMREIADKVGAVFMVDMAHFAGLVAGKVLTGDYDPAGFAHVITTTTHKTLRGPRGGLVLCTGEFAEAVDRGCPLVIGGPLPHVMAAKLVALEEVSEEGFKDYAEQVVRNSKTLAENCKNLGMNIVTGGTDNHLFLVDVRSYGLTGRQAESALRDCRITLNRNSIPFDPNGAWYTSGIRAGTPAVTTLGMKEADMQEIAEIVYIVLSASEAETITKGKNAGQKSKVRYKVKEGVKEELGKRIDALLSRYPVYPELDLPFLLRHFG